LKRKNDVWGGKAISGTRLDLFLRPGAVLGIAVLFALQVDCGAKPSSRSANAQEMLSAHASPLASTGRTDEHEAKALGELLKKKPDHVPVLLRMATLSLESGKSAEAEKYLGQVLKLEPGNVPARLDLGKILFEAGKAPEAIGVTEEILKTQPGNPDALYNLGAIYGNLGQKQRAIEFWSRLLAVSPESESGKRAKQMMAELLKSP
jgi:predicted Zn-dependent protease